MACVYMHLTADTNTPFYIGKGSGRRPWNKSNRTAHWHNIVNKHGYTVTILYDNLSDEEAYQIEINEIAKYGRKENGGILINLTDGGDGKSGHTQTEEAKRKIGEATKQRSKDIKFIQKLSESVSGPNNPMYRKEPWNKGKKIGSFTEEHKRKLSESVKNSHKYKEAMADPTVRERLSLSKIGKAPPNKGKKLNKRTRKFI